MPFETVLEELLHPAFALAQAMLRDRQEAEDAVQEAFLRAWYKRNQFRDRGSGPRPWILKIVANECRSRRRAPWARVQRQADVEPAGDAGDHSRTELRLDLAAAMSRLNTDQLVVLRLFHQLDLPQEEIAQILGIKVGTVRSRLHRGVSRLREILDEEEVR